MAYETMGTPELEGMAMDMAAQVDQNQETMTMARAPEGDFSLTRLNAVVDALNDVVDLFPDVEIYPSFQEEVDLFPDEFVTYLDIVSAAARDAGVDELDIAIEGISDDSDLTLLAGQLKSLAKNKDFQRFMKSEYAAAPEEVVEEEVIAPDEQPPEEVDTLFMERM